MPLSWIFSVQHLAEDFFFTLAGEAVYMEVCFLHTHHLPATNLPTALTHNGRVSPAGERRAAAAVVVSSIKTWMVLNWEEEREKRGDQTDAIVILRSLILSFYLHSKIRSKCDKHREPLPWTHQRWDVFICHLVTWMCDRNISEQCIKTKCSGTLYIPIYTYGG